MGDWLEMVRKVADLYPGDSAAHIALRTIAELADAGHIIDTRRIEALADEHGLAALVNEDPGRTGSDTSDDCAWIVEYGLRGLRGRRETPWCSSAAEALDAAERETQ